jgi:hypothetical protein
MVSVRSCFAAVVCAAAIAVSLAPFSSAQAACAKHAYSVNDYGKEGPMRDAKALLDKSIARWAKEKGIKTYRTGKKHVTCELYLDLGVFDEYTCKAVATVCWGAKRAAAPVPAPETTAAIPAEKPADDGGSDKKD